MISAPRFPRGGGEAGLERAPRLGAGLQVHSPDPDPLHLQVQPTAISRGSGAALSAVLSGPARNRPQPLVTQRRGRKGGDGELCQVHLPQAGSTPQISSACVSSQMPMGAHPTAGKEPRATNTGRRLAGRPSCLASTAPVRRTGQTEGAVPPETLS